MMLSSDFRKKYGISYAYLHDKIKLELLKVIPKVCTNCGSTKNIELANTNGHNYSLDIRDYTFLCSRCHIALDKRYANLKQGSDAIYSKSLFYNPTMTEKECTKCHCIKKLSEFGNSRSHCRECDNQLHKDKLRAKGTSKILKLRDGVARGVRTCSVCNKEKNLFEFVKNGRTTRTICKLCYREQQNARYRERMNDRRCY